MFGPEGGRSRHCCALLGMDARSATMTSPSCRLGRVASRLCPLASFRMLEPVISWQLSAHPCARRGPHENASAPAQVHLALAAGAFGHSRSHGASRGLSDAAGERSEEHTSELQSLRHLV